MTTSSPVTKTFTVEEAYDAWNIQCEEFFKEKEEQYAYPADWIVVVKRNNSRYVRYGHCETCKERTAMPSQYPVSWCPKCKSFTRKW